MVPLIVTTLPRGQDSLKSLPYTSIREDVTLLFPDTSTGPIRLALPVMASLRRALFLLHSYTCLMDTQINTVGHGGGAPATQQVDATRTSRFLSAS